jgi:hypothetical protein
MNGGLSTPFIKFPIATSLIMVGILFVGSEGHILPRFRDAGDEARVLLREYIYLDRLSQYLGALVAPARQAAETEYREAAE